jgi:hypothetical protein
MGFRKGCRFDAVGVIIVVFNIVAVLDIVGLVLRNPHCSLANFATREALNRTAAA